MEKETFSGEKIKGLLTFDISGKLFCANIQDVAAIINPEELNQEEHIHSSVPHIVLSSIKIPLIDLNKIYNFEPQRKTGDNRIVVIEIESKLIGFFVEKVSDAYNVDDYMLKNIEFNASREIPYLIGILKYEDKAMHLMDFHNLIAHENI